MKFSWFRFQPKVKFFLCIFLFFTVSLGIKGNNANHVLAQNNTSTYNRAETLNLKRQIRQLEGEIRRLNQLNMRSNSLTPSRIPRSNISNPPIVNGQPIGRSDPMFQRLATLLIELKEDVRNLDKRMTAIEQKLAE